MPAKRSAMRKIKEVLRLKFEAQLSHQRIAAATGLSKGAVSKYVRRAVQKGLGWPVPEQFDDAELERTLFKLPSVGVGRALPDFGHIHQELKRRGVTLQLLWEEYQAAEGQNSYRYSQFCEHYRRYRERLARSMRQVHRAGEKLFIDYSGDTVDIIDAGSGQIRSAEIFVAVMGASKYTYAEASWTQSLPDWIASHIRTFEYLGAVPALLVPDNLKSAIKHACRYEPEATSTYGDLARHYGTAILPARPYQARDKAAVETHVLVVQRWILARLRNRQFFSLLELNGAIGELLRALNERPFKRLPGSRSSAFESIDRPAMKPLPAARYEYADWLNARAGIDYHIEVDRHYYSVPHALVRQVILVRLTATTVECFLKGRRIAAHLRSYVRGAHTTVAEHMPDSHRRHREWSPARLLSWGEKIGAATRAVVQWQLEHRPHPEQGYRACLGLLNAAKTYGEARLEAACRRALTIGSPTRRRILAILKARLDQHPELFPTAEAPATSAREHANVRGAEYFRSTLNSTTEGDDDPCSSNPSSIH